MVSININKNGARRIRLSFIFTPKVECIELFSSGILAPLRIPVSPHMWVAPPPPMVGWNTPPPPPPLLITFSIVVSYFFLIVIVGGSCSVD